MATSEIQDFPPEVTIEIPRPAESDRQRAETDDQGWGRKAQGDGAESEATAEAPEAADDTDAAKAGRRGEAEIDAEAWGRASRQPIVEAARVDRDKLREAMVDQAEPAEDTTSALEEVPTDDRLTDARAAVEDAYLDAAEPEAELVPRPIGEHHTEPTEVFDGSDRLERNPELPPPIGHEDAELADHDFTEDQITPMVGGHSNGAYEIDSRDGDRMVYKPASDEVLLRNDIDAGSYWRHEVAAYQVDQLLGFDLVPPTAAVEGPSGVGSLQEWSPEAGYLAEDYNFRDQQMMGVLDYVLGSSDRHPRNYLSQADGRPSAIDNGLSLPSVDHDGMYSEFADSVFHQPLDQSIVERVNRVDDTNFVTTLRRCGIAEAAIDRALTRLHECQTGQIDGTAWDGLIFGSHQEQLR